MMWCQASPCCPSVQFHVLCEICAATYPNDGVGVVVMNPGLAFEASHVTRLWRDTSSTNAAVALKQGSIAGGKMMTPTYGFVDVLLPRFLYVGNQLGEISPEPLRIDLQSFTPCGHVFSMYDGLPRLMAPCLRLFVCQSVPDGERLAVLTLAKSVRAFASRPRTTYPPCPSPSRLGSGEALVFCDFLSEMNVYMFIFIWDFRFNPDLEGTPSASTAPPSIPSAFNARSVAHAALGTHSVVLFENVSSAAVVFATTNTIGLSIMLRE